MKGTLLETVAQIEADGGKAIALECDIEDANQCSALLQRASEEAGANVDILVNNAGFGGFAPISKMSIKVFDRMLTHNLRAPFLLIQAALPAMRAAGVGWIINIGSQDALPPARPYADHEKVRGYHPYAAAKAGLHRLTQGMAAELIDANIAVNLVAPSTAIRTEGADALIPADYPTEDVAYLAETVLAMSHLPAPERTGLLACSMHFPMHHHIEVRSLDGKTILPPAEPAPWSHAAICASGL